MGKYDPLGAYLAAQQVEAVPVRFEELERILGFPLPPSRRYPAWWSNNPSNNPMTRVWLAAGFETEQVDPEGGRVVFRRKRPAAGARRSGPYPGFGALKGAITVAPDLDLTAPTDADWDAAG